MVDIKDIHNERNKKQNINLKATYCIFTAACGIFEEP